MMMVLAPTTPFVVELKLALAVLPFFSRLLALVCALLPPSLSLAVAVLCAHTQRTHTHTQTTRNRGC
jgi:hypothetical protein